MYFYEILQNIMDEKKLTIAEVSRLSNLTDSTVRSIISRKNKTVALKVAFKLSRGLNVPIEYLVNTPQEQEKRIAFSNRLKQALQLRNMTAAELARRTNTPESVISQYKKGLYEPKQKRLQQFSEILDVSIPWLIGEDTSINAITQNSKFISLENEQENRIVKNYRNLNHDGQTKLIDYLDDLILSGRYKKEEEI